MTDAKDEIDDLLSVRAGSVWQSKIMPDMLIVEVIGVGSAPDMVSLYDSKYERHHGKAYFEVNIIDFRDIYEPYQRTP